MLLVKELEQHSLTVSEADNNSGLRMHQFIRELMPIPRSLTGDGVRQTLEAIRERIPLIWTEVQSGTKALDWNVPKEWNITDGYIADADGNRVVDFHDCPLHVLGYSVPVRKRMTLAELRPHLHSDPEHPDWIPFRYSYYHQDWGFCLSDKALQALPDGEYEVVIDSSLEDGSLTYAECYIPGKSKNEVLISVHVCHPWMCNDNLSGIAVATELAERLSRTENFLSYRFLFMPTTIGSLTWLSRNEDHLHRIKHGLVLTCVGDSGSFHYKRTRDGNSAIDDAFAYALEHGSEPYTLLDFSPFGFDERQYSSPGFNLPVGCLMRTPGGKYPQYHSSGDDLNFVKPERLAGTLNICEQAFRILDQNHSYLNCNPKGEPQLGKRGIYRTIGGPVPGQNLLSMFWVLSYSDGRCSLLDIAKRSKIPFAEIRAAADILERSNLLQWVPC